MRKIMVKILGIAVLLITLCLPNTCAFANEEKTSWKQLDAMSVAQGDDVQTEVIDGKIYAFGWCWNSNDAKILSPTEVYDPYTDTWATLASMPIPRWGFETEVINGKIYAIGGWGIGGTPVTSTEVYDPSTDAWTVLAPMSVAQRYYFQTEVIDGKIYDIGDNPGSTCTPTTEVYDPSTDTWTILSAMPTAREEFQTEVIDGKIYAIGGYSGLEWGHNSDINSLSSAEVYDPSTDTWTTLASMSTTRCFFQTEVIDGKIYAIGGLNISVGDSEGKSLSPTEVYDPSTNTWTTLASMFTARQAFQTEVIDGKIYALGGVGIFDGIDGICISSTEVYDPSSNTWTTLDSMSDERYFSHSEVIDKVIYAIDGRLLESYTVDTNAPK